MKKNIPLTNEVISLWWGFIDESYNPQIITELVAETISKRWYGILQYNDCLWLPELRKYGIDFLKEKFGIGKINHDEIMIINGATAGIDLVTRYILQGKYNAIALTPTYDTALETLKTNAKEVLPFKLWIFNNEDLIPDWEEFQELMKQEDTKLIYVNTNFQNPTGVIFDKKTKEKIYNLAEKYWVIILEDDPYKLYNFDKHDLWDNIINLDLEKKNVIYLNSISKVFYPGMRIGFLVWNKDVVHDISELQKYSTSSPNLIMQWASIEAFKRGEIDKTITHYIQEVTQKSQIIYSELEKYWLIWDSSPIEFSKSKWGFYLWGKFKDEKNTDELVKQALNYGVSFVPGSIYWIDKEYNDSFRMAYAQIDKNNIPEAIKRFDSLVRKK